MRGMVEPILRLVEVAKSYPTAQGSLPVLDGVSLELAVGSSLALTGESGSGKSTLLHLAAGLDDADRGEVHLAGAALGRLGDAGRAALRRHEVGIVFQQFNLIPSLDVRGNLGFQARLAGRHDVGRLAGLAARLGLGGLLDRYPEQLSGGQQQRVAIGRALAAGPRLILADEPTGSLDEATGDAVLDLMLALVAEAGAALLMATHSMRLAARLGGVARLHEGRLC
ncbi:MAG TPA: ABC transporter ATP-binding protein [Amaricoccus sp.]|nr:ABC transporter ATP-binding protein [Amaricoccus sp.]